MGSQKWIDIRRAKVAPEHEGVVDAAKDAARVAIELASLRESAGVTQVELAGRLGITQGNVSRLEHRDDVYLSSLRDYIEALGGNLRITAMFDDAEIELDRGLGQPPLGGGPHRPEFTKGRVQPAR